MAMIAEKKVLHISAPQHDKAPFSGPAAAVHVAATDIKAASMLRGPSINKLMHQQSHARDTQDDLLA